MRAPPLRTRDACSPPRAANRGSARPSVSTTYSSTTRPAMPARSRTIGYRGEGCSTTWTGSSRDSAVHSSTPPGGAVPLPDDPEIVGFDPGRSEAPSCRSSTVGAVAGSANGLTSGTGSKRLPRWRRRGRAGNAITCRRARNRRSVRRHEYNDWLVGWSGRRGRGLPGQDAAATTPPWRPADRRRRRALGRACGPDAIRARSVREPRKEVPPVCHSLMKPRRLAP
jgi:hypothetical protein